MTLEQLKATLLLKPSYFKESALTISDRFDVPVELAEQALYDLSDYKRAYRVKSNLELTREQELEIELLKLRAQIANMREKESRDAFISVPETSLKPYKNGNKRNVLVIGDLHEPFCLDGYLEHTRKIQEEFDAGTIVFIGDMLDNHAISYHEHDPDGLSPTDEYSLALARLKNWYKIYPEAYVCIGNHDSLGHRKLFSAGMPANWLKNHKELTKCPESYKWDFSHVVEGVYYTHGTGVSGDNGAMKIANQNRQSAVIGHLHSVANIKYSASYKDLIFAMTVGCGIDRHQYAFNYGREMPAKPIISCGVVLEGKIPILLPMNLE